MALVYLSAKKHDAINEATLAGYIDPSTANDFYSLFDLPSTASLSDINKSFRDQSLIVHDLIAKGENLTVSKEAKFVLLSKIFRILKDPELRKRYDQLRSREKVGQVFKRSSHWFRNLSTALIITFVLSSVITIILTISIIQYTFAWILYMTASTTDRNVKPPPSIRNTLIIRLPVWIYQIIMIVPQFLKYVMNGVGKGAAGADAIEWDAEKEKDGLMSLVLKRGLVSSRKQD
ncbi:hypothetical protein HDU76_012934 [Blyttiomyces sp. JEL0837]|nr:hypothetical protein HDU76_012934 [Blyttiomyces sp. JEL0837]